MQKSILIHLHCKLTHIQIICQILHLRDFTVPLVFHLKVEIKPLRDQYVFSIWGRNTKLICTSEGKLSICDISLQKCNSHISSKPLPLRSWGTLRKYVSLQVAKEPSLAHKEDFSLQFLYCFILWWEKNQVIPLDLKKLGTESWRDPFPKIFQCHYIAKDTRMESFNKLSKIAYNCNRFLQ